MRRPSRRRQRCRVSPACASSAIRDEPGLHRHLQPRRGTGARRVPGVPQQRHDRHRGLARRDARRVRRRIRTRDSSAPSSSIPMAACRKPAASCGATARRGTAAATTIPTGPNTTTCARSTTARARASRFRRRCSASWAASTRATRRPTTRTPTSRSPCARRGRKVYYQPLATIVHFEGQTSGTDETHGGQAAPGRQPGDVRREMGRRAGRRIAPTACIAELERDRWAKWRVLVIDACMLTPDQDSGSVRMHGDARNPDRRCSCKVTFVADNLEYRQPYVSATAAARQSRCCSIRTCARSPTCCPSAAPSSTSS